MQRRLPVLVTYGDSDVLGMRGWHGAITLREHIQQALAHWVSRHTAANIVVAPHLAEALRDQHTYAIPDGADLQRFQRNPGIDCLANVPSYWRDKVIIGTVGSLLPKKSPELFVCVARHVLEVCPNARFLRIGKGTLARTSSCFAPPT